ncbi:hypothetical protein [Piscinibacter sp.]|jgi:hypothetical protein|uniref:hypothetical protein n=1 Tax=Piscinibacter sp. TaxID=1903157 RepID=UPI00355ABDCB
MTLQQFHALKLWHTRHGRNHVVERTIWELVLTLWLVGWVGAAVSTVLAIVWAQLACLVLLFLPQIYVAWRTRLHRHGQLRCDWIGALR